MSAHSVLRAIAACAPGRRVVVSVPSGKVYRLPIAPEPVRPEPPHPLAVLSQQLLERDAQMDARNETTLSAVRSALDGLAAAHAEGVREIVGTLHLPVVPTKYDKDGRMIEARRKEST